jgi:hypothetical protein
MSLHTNFAAVACPVEGQFLPAMLNMEQFLTLRYRMLRLILSIKEGQKFDPPKVCMKNGCKFKASES